MAFKWNRELIEKLITLVEENNCIYNVKCKEYLDRDKKAQSYNTILKEMQTVASSITMDEIKRKWKNLRTQFSQEMRRIKQSKKSGAGSADIYAPKLWCFQQLNFLQTHIDVRESINNIKIETQDVQSEICSTQEESSFDEPPAKRRTGSSSINVFRNEVKDLKTLISRRKNEKKFAWLGNLVTARMEEIHPNDQGDAAWQVECIMRKLCNQSAEKIRLKSTSSVSTEISEEAPSCSSQNRNIEEEFVCCSPESRDILELSMQGIFGEDDFD